MAKIIVLTGGCPSCHCQQCRASTMVPFYSGLHPSSSPLLYLSLSALTTVIHAFKRLDWKCVSQLLASHVTGAFLAALRSLAPRCRCILSLTRRWMSSSSSSNAAVALHFSQSWPLLTDGGPLGSLACPDSKTKKREAPCRACKWRHFQHQTKGTSRCKDQAAALSHPSRWAADDSLAVTHPRNGRTQKPRMPPRSALQDLASPYAPFSLHTQDASGGQANRPWNRGLL
jgi:hypothetical protein